MNLSLNNFKRFEKQIILKKIGINGQKRILNSRVLIIGIGGLTKENSWLLPVAPPVELSSIMLAGLLVTSL